MYLLNVESFNQPFSCLCEIGMNDMESYHRFKRNFNKVFPTVHVKTKCMIFLSYKYQPTTIPLTVIGIPFITLCGRLCHATKFTFKPLRWNDTPRKMFDNKQDRKSDRDTSGEYGECKQQMVPKQFSFCSLDIIF